MALLGPHLVITLVMVSIIRKLGRHISISKKILCYTGLTRYLYPTDDELRALAGIQKTGKGSRKGRHKGENGRVGDVFHIEKSLEFKLETAKVVELDVTHLKFYSEFQWLLDFSVAAAIVYLLSEASQLFFRIKDDFNLSIIWCLLVIGFTTSVLFSLTRQYFQGDDSGERSTVMVAGFFYFFFAMGILIVDESHLELGLDSAYKSFNQSAAAFLERQGVDSSGPASKLVLKFFLALWCGIIGALFTFPGLRMARMHWDALKTYNDRKLLKILLNINFASPFILTLLWIRPISREYLTARVFQGMSAPIMTPACFESFRLITVIVAVILRFSLMPLYLQCYLDMARTRVEALKKESGRILNTDLQKRIAAIFYYLCVVALQYIAPLLMCLFFTFMYKTLGGFTWTGALLEPVDECPLTPPPTLATTDSLKTQYDSEESSIRESAHQFTLAFESLKQVFTAEVYRGLFGLMTWWTCFAWFTSSAGGFVYQSYFTHI